MNRTLPLLLALVLAAVLPAAATTVPNAFVHEFLVGEPFGGWPVGFAFLPDGRLLIIERETGVTRLAAVGAATSDSIHTIPDVEAVHPERGLLGVAVDPGWPAQPRVYFDYTSVDSVTKIVRYEATGDLEDPASTNLTLTNRYVIVDSIEDLNGIHNAGTLRFAPDGTLLVSVGDDQRGCLAQDLGTPHGKILRLDVSSLPSGGSGPPPLAELDPGDNPFGGTGWQALVWAWGLRNPYRFTVDGPTGDVFIGSVGSHTFEEINRIPGSNNPGPNFGWPEFEGFDPMDCCGDCPLAVEYTFPIWAIPHPIDLISVVGGPVMRHAGASPISFPSSHDGDCFFFEIYSGDLVRLRETGGVWSPADPIPGQPSTDHWGEGFVGASDAQLGPDGALWLTSIGIDFFSLPRGIHRIRADSTATGLLPSSPPAAPSRPTVRAEPNPARPGTSVTIRYDVSIAGPAEITIHDAAGRTLARLDDRARRSGRRTLFWDGRDSRGGAAAPGVYLVRVRLADGREAHGKIAIVR